MSLTSELTRRTVGSWRRQHTRHGYHLTDSGRDLLPVLDALLTWGRSHAVAKGDPDLRRQRHRRLADLHPQETR